MHTGKPVVKVCVSLHVSLDFNHFILIHSSIWVDTFNKNGPRIVRNVLNSHTNLVLNSHTNLLN